MDPETSPWPLVLGAIPALAALLKVVWPSGDRSLHHTVRRMAETAGLMADGEGRAALEKEADLLGQELAFQEGRRARRRWAGSSIAAVVVVALVGGGITVGLWATDNPWLRLVGVLVAVFATLLVLAGLPQLRPVADRYRFQDAE